MTSSWWCKLHAQTSLGTSYQQIKKSHIKLYPLKQGNQHSKTQTNQFNSQSIPQTITQSENVRLKLTKMLTSLRISTRSSIMMSQLSLTKMKLIDNLESTSKLKMQMIRVQRWTHMIHEYAICSHLKFGNSSMTNSTSSTTIDLIFWLSPS